MKKFLTFSILFLAGMLAIAACGHCLPTEHLLTGQHLIPPYMAIAVATIDSTRTRAAYQKTFDIASCIMEKFQGRAQEIIVNRDYLLSEQVINNNISTYTFELLNKTLQAQSPRRPGVKGILDNDLFVAIRCRLLLDCRTVTSAGVPQSNVEASPWPDPIVFGPSGCTIADLWTIYDGNWSLQVDRVVYIPGDFIRKMLAVPPFYTIQVPAGGATPLPTGAASIPPYQVNGENTWYKLDPYPTLSGRLDNILKVNLSLYPGWNGQSLSSYISLQNVISFEFDGFTVKNGAGYIPFFNGSLDINTIDPTTYEVGANI